MKFHKITPDIIEKVTKIIGNDYVITNKDKIENYSHDETEKLVFFPEVVLLPKTPKEISEILKLCNKELIPVTPRGLGTGLSGGALPVCKGFLLSMERFNKIIDIDKKNLQATVEPGVITETFQQKVIKQGLFYPPDPASKEDCSIGGNIAENSGGPKAVKYGVTKDYVLNLEIVLPTGEIVWTGANTLKNSTGYNITQLMIGSEGTLGIITKIVFKLIPFPKHSLMMLVPFYSAQESCKAVSEVFKAGITPSAMEFMERDAIIETIKNIKDVNISVKDDIQAHLLIEVDGNNLKILNKERDKIYKIMQNFDCDKILFADNKKEKKNLMYIRTNVGKAVKSYSIYKEEDTVVPRAELPALLKGIKKTGKKYGFKTICYGHAGDGNLHVNIIKEGMSDYDWNNKLKYGIKEIFELCKKLGGTISGEHGIGYTQKQYINIVFSEKLIEIQKNIKKLFDPNNILNPEKMFP